MAVLVRIGSADGICRIELHRPEVRNALDDDARRTLADAIARIADDPTIRVVVVHGAGKAFSSGADTKERAGPHLSWQARRRAAGGWQRVLDAWEALPQVTIAAMHGYAIGGGLLLAAACDLRVAEETTWFSIPELSLGLPLTWAGLPRLEREIGLPRTRDMVLTGRKVTADEAHAWGLVQRLVPHRGLGGAVEDLVGKLLAAPAAPMAMTKEALVALGRARGTSAVSWADPDLLAWSLREET